MKTCFKCGTEKELSAFYKHPRMPDGHVNKCKECNKRDVRENRAAKVDYYREYDKHRYQNDTKTKDRIVRYVKKWEKEYPIKKAASTIVGNAVRDGRLFKPSYCSECGAFDRVIHGHHDDYAYPMTVRWLCPPCHRNWHDENGPGLNF